MKKGRNRRMENKIYKDEDTEIIYAFLKEFDADIEKRKAFSCALKRKMIEKYHVEEELKKYKKKEEKKLKKKESR